MNNENHETIIEKSSINGNKAAFEAIIDKIDEWHANGEMEHWQYSELFDIADTALASPQRNCDVGTVKEQLYRHEKYCNLQTTCKRWLRDNDSSMCISCFANWLHKPYKEEIIV